MAKTIEFKYDGEDYCLEFTRGSVVALEKKGFVIDDLMIKPMTTFPMLFSGAFLAHHRWTKSEVIETIYEKLVNKEELIAKLAEMYNDTLYTLLNDPEDESGNVKWGANF